MGFKFNGIIVHFPRKEKHRDVIGDEIFRKSREKIYYEAESIHPDESIRFFRGE